MLKPFCLSTFYLVKHIYTIYYCKKIIAKTDYNVIKKNKKKTKMFINKNQND